MTFSRRDFVKTSVLGAVAVGVGTQAQGRAEQAPRKIAVRNLDAQASHHCLRQQRLRLSRKCIRLSEGRRRHARCRAQSGERSGRRSQ